MNIITQKYIKLIEKIIKSKVEQSLSSILSKLSISHKHSVFNYINVLNDIETVFVIAARDTLKKFIESVDEAYRVSFKRKKIYHIKAYSTRCILTLFGPVEYKKTYYVHKFTKESFCYTDKYLGLCKYEFVDPYLKAMIVDKLSSNNYQQVANQINELVGKNTVKSEYLNRQYIYNVLKNSKVSVPKYVARDTPSELYIIADEKFISIQKDKKKKIMIKHAVVFEGFKGDNKRRSLINKHHVMTYNDSISSSLLDYLHNTYELDKVKAIYFMGDGANWIKNLSNHFKFPNTLLVKSLDKYHYRQALKHINVSTDIQNVLHNYLFHDVLLFKNLCNELIKATPHREFVIDQKMNYLLNNRDIILNLYNYNLSCPMESQISHNIASLMSSRPKAYSIAHATKLINLRSLKLNKHNIINLMLMNHLKDDIQDLNKMSFDTSMFNKMNNGQAFINGTIIHKNLKKIAY